MKNLDQKGVNHEINFWKTFVKSERFLQGWVSQEKTPELNQIVYMFINTLNPEEVLDLGSGPVSILNGTFPKEKITTCDPLSQLYQEIFPFSTYGITPPEDYPCEELPEEWTGRFPLVHMSNALDHTRSPQEALQSLTRVCRADGHIIIQGFTNEAVHENYQGFHQWNLRLEGNDLMIGSKNKETRYIPQAEVLLAHTEKCFNGRDWFIWILKKI